MLRVNVTPAPVSELRVAVDGPWRVQPVGSARVLAEGDRLAPTELTATDQGFRLGERELRVARIELFAVKPPGVWAGDHQYRGSLRAVRQTRGRFLAVNVLPLEDYVASVVDSEMPAEFADAAREAQAIVARSYALYQFQVAGTPAEFDLYASTRSQKYLGYVYRDGRGRLLAGESESARRAARATQGVVCTDRGRLFCTYYSAVCGGHTTLGIDVFSDASPLLESVPCEFCEAAELYRWSGKVTKESLLDALRNQPSSRGRGLEEIELVTPEFEGVSGPADRFVFSGGRDRLRISAADLRRILPRGAVHSPHFTIRIAGGDVLFEGRGHGHGVGFCQWGARGQAHAGRTAVQNLEHN
jgi:stage II sporulation protein D